MIDVRQKRTGVHARGVESGPISRLRPVGTFQRLNIMDEGVHDDLLLSVAVKICRKNDGKGGKGVSQIVALRCEIFLRNFHLLQDLGMLNDRLVMQISVLHVIYACVCCTYVNGTKTDCSILF